MSAEVNVLPEGGEEYFFHRSHYGPSYRTFIKEVASFCQARTYLEIGTNSGESLADVSCDSIAVDPNFSIERNVIGKKRALHCFQQSSDQFFLDRDPVAIVGRQIDIAFLDGMHKFEYLLRDFMNTEKCCTRESVIFMHDCLPVNCEMAERIHSPRARKDKSYANWWTGDVWKILPALASCRPDLSVTCLDCAPTGLVAVTHLNPRSDVLTNAYYELVRTFVDAPFGNGDIEAFYGQFAVEDSAAIIKEGGMGKFFSPPQRAP